MNIYAKCRHRLKYIDFIAIVNNGDAGYEAITLLKKGKLLFPIGM
jgi:hypothetical protein